MSSKSNNQGRAFEYVYINNLFEEISKVRSVTIEKNSCYFAAERAWNTLSKDEQIIFKSSAFASINTLFDLEPLILEDDFLDEGFDSLELKI